jgi:hypothetical protein
MKTSLMFPMCGGLLLTSAFFLVPGCDSPEVPRGEYGEIIDELPDFPHSPKTLPIPDGVLPREQQIESL